ncbi:MAG: DUF2752 domain-containing protein [Polyangiaceae bacterium]
MDTTRGDPGARKRWVAPLALSAALVLLVVVPTPVTCPVRLAFHVPCPSCGLTRATWLAITGHPVLAWHMHPLVFVLVPALAAMLALESRAYVRTGRWGQVTKERWATRGMGALVVLLLGVWIARFFGAFGGPAPV